MRRNNFKPISRLHFITHPVIGISVTQAAHEALQAGATWIQLRHKELSAEELLGEARDIGKLCHQYGATLVINDNVEVAKSSNADGVHLGKEDMHPLRARELLRESSIGKTFIGGTANSLNDAIDLVEAGVDYIGLGPFRFTPTKKSLAPVLGLKGIGPVIRFCIGEKVPVIVIGGVTIQDVPSIISLGAHGVAVSLAIYEALSIAHGVREFFNVLGEQHAVA